MNKQELVDTIALETGASKKSVEAIINATMKTIVKTVAGGDKVTLVGFGAFEKRSRQARTGRNPKTGEVLNIPAKTAVAFRVGQEFKDTVNKKKK